WEQCKLGDVCDVYDGIHHTPDYQDNGIMFLSVENISTLTSDKFISRDFFEQNYKIFPEKGDILLTRIGNVGTPNVVESTDKLAYYVSLALLKAPKINSYFLCNLICTQEFKKELHRKTLTTAIPQKINKDEIRKITFFDSTSSDERKKIGSLLEKINFTITLHEEKKRQLERLKSALLQKMFADENGYPAVRFRGFDEAWKQCKLGDVFVERNQKTVADKNYPLCSFIAHKGVVPKAKYDRSFLVKSDDKKYKRTELNDFIYSSNNLETGSIGLNKFGNATISPVYSVFMVKGNSEFIAGLATTHRFIYEMIRFRQGVVYGQWRINESDFLKIKYYIPQVLEQEEIGNLLSELDRTITLHDQKLNLLKLVKQSLLQNMFI
ncbi:hypothetical protein BTI30_09100, partial [Lactobacillus delbrueckii subsp. bulgaricus]|nr:hypothetical protein [Lactobacillus delbrueckii subsp. bulgaricus]